METVRVKKSWKKNVSEKFTAAFRRILKTFQNS